MKKQSIITGIRIRPLLNDLQKDDKICLSHQNNQITFFYQHKLKKFNVHHILSENSTQQQTYEIFALPLVQQFFNGFNCTLIALGQQKSGKSITMCGKQTQQTKGLIPRSIDQIFLTVKYFQQTKFLFKVSYFEIYQQEIYDLLSVKKCKIDIKQGKNKKILINNLQKKSIQKVQDIQSFFQIGNRKKSYAYAKKYRKQSQSTSIFTIYLQSLDKNGKVVKSLINFCQTSAINIQTRDKIQEQTKLKVKQFYKLNLSKVALNNVLNSLVYGNQYGVPINSFNDSKFTKILRESFGGNSKTTIIANISPSQKSLQNSLEVMKLLQLSSKIENNVSSLIDIEQCQIKTIINQIQKLKDQIQSKQDQLSHFDVQANISRTKQKIKNETKNYYDNEFVSQQIVQEHAKQHQKQKNKELRQQIRKLKIKIKQREIQIINFSDKNKQSQAEFRKIQKNQQERKLLLSKIQDLKLKNKLIQTLHQDRPLKKQLFQMEKQFQIERQQYLQTIRYLEQKASFYHKIAETALKKEEIRILKINSKYDPTKRQCQIPMFLIKDKKIQLNNCYNNSPKNLPVSQRKFYIWPRSSSFNSLAGSRNSKISFFAEKNTNIESIANRSYKNLEYKSKQEIKSPINQTKRKNLKLKLSEAINRKQIQDQYDIHRVIQLQKNRLKQRSKKKSLEGYKLLKKKEIFSSQSKTFFEKNK